MDKENALQKLFTESQDADRCKSIDIAQNRTFVTDLGHGDPNSDLFFIGEAPGKEEDKQGIPFVGQAGQIFNENLQNAGLSRNDVWVSNIVKFRPTENNGSKNRKPTVYERDACLPLLRKEIEIVDPEIIIPMGNTAYRTLTGTRTSISDAVGKKKKWKDRWLFPMYHPAYAIYNRNIRRDMKDHMKKLSDLFEKT